MSACQFVPYLQTSLYRRSRYVLSINAYEHANDYAELLGIITMKLVEKKHFFFQQKVVGWLQNEFAVAMQKLYEQFFFVFKISTIATGC